MRSVHEGEAFLVFLALFSGEFLLKSDLVLFAVVVLESGFDKDTAGHHSSNTLS